MYLYIQPNKCNLFDEQMIYVLVLFSKSEIYSTISVDQLLNDWFLWVSSLNLILTNQKHYTETFER